MKFKATHISIAIISSVLLSGCKTEEKPYSYYLAHPAELEADYNYCMNHPSAGVCYNIVQKYFRYKKDSNNINVLARTNKASKQDFNIKDYLIDIDAPIKDDLT